MHVSEYLAIAELSGTLLGADVWPTESGTSLIIGANAVSTVSVHPRMQRPDRPPSRVRRRFAWAAVLAVAAIGAMIVLGMMKIGSASRYATERGEQRSLTLADGSVVQINTLTRLVVRFDGNIRLVELPAGEALFRVAHEPGRPFVVRTPFAAVRAVGTQFNVDTRAQGTRVAVIEGRVAVDRDITREGKALTLGAGEQAVVTHRAVTRVAAIPPERTLAWVQRRLIFKSQRLDAAVEEFNRYNRTQLVIAAPELAALRINGVFDADDPQVLVRYLERVQGAQAAVSQDEVRLSLPR